MTGSSFLSALALGFAGWLALSPAIAHAADADRPDGRMLSCESIGSQLKACQADTHGGVRLARRLSRSACVEGQSWGATGDGIWVKDGCRAQFAIGYGSRAAGSGYGARVVRCDSSHSRWNHCAAETRRGIELVRQLSERACIRDRSWGTDERGIWVSGGCRAEFRVRASHPDRDDDDVARAQMVRCESRVGRPTRCPVDTEGGVRLVRQLSKAACTKDQTWNFDDDGIWVERGCRADFEVSVGEKQGRGWRFWRSR